MRFIVSNQDKFKLGQKVVYPSHGVGEIVEIEAQKIMDMTMEVYVISFPQDKMTLRVPVSRAEQSGLRALSTKDDVQLVYSILNEKPKRGSKMWSRRAQEYEGKLNSGDIKSVAEVVRDLCKNVDSDRSYSERNIYENALNRLASEISVLQQESEETTLENLVKILERKLAVA